VATIAVGVRGCNGFLIKLSEKNVGDGVMHGLGCVLEQIGKADVESSFAKTDRCVQRSKAAEPDVKRGNRRTRTKTAILLLKDRDKRGVHCESRLTCRRVVLGSATIP
jgi:hypothetical protein